MRVQFSQLSTSRRRLRDEEQPFKHHTQPWLDPSPQLGTKALVIILEFEALLIDGHQMVFEGSFENNNETHTVN